jgi:S-methylmethionine-dependent homocysteine/selenocysteine methylase
MTTFNTICRVTWQAALATAQFIWAHRAEIRAAIIRIIAACILAAQLTYQAGCWTRRTIEALNERSADLLPGQPLPTVAPITANIQAIREALTRLVNRLYPQPINS